MELLALKQLNNNASFGLTNAPATFQRPMECILSGLNMEQCLIYIDDIIIFGSTVDEHLQRLTRVFDRLREAGLKLQPKKCHLVQERVKYLGHIVSAGGVQPDPEKLQAVTAYPIPVNVKQLRQFLGLTNYYRRFIHNYSEIAGPLFKLLKKEKQFAWNAQAQEAFIHLKERLVTLPILAFPDFTQEFTV
jgi:hypothetical protein